MATIGTVPTLIDVAKRLDPGGKIDKMVEIMNLTNDVIQDAVHIEGNLPTGHRHTVRDALPTPTWRRINAGVVPTKSTSHQVDDVCGMLEAYAEVDKKLADLNGNTAAFRLSEDKAHLEGMSQAWASTLFYGNMATNPERFTGLANRYATISTSTTNIGYNIINAGGTGSDNTSMWLITWSPETTFCIYPKGSMAGLKMEDLGQVTLGDSTNGYYEGYRSHYMWDTGLAVKDWRHTVRVANIDVSSLSAAPSAGADLVTHAITAKYRLPNMNGGKHVWYVNATIAEYLEHQARNKTNVNLLLKDQGGDNPVVMLAGFPVRRCDSLLLTEATVS